MWLLLLVLIWMLLTFAQSAILGFQHYGRLDAVKFATTKSFIGDNTEAIPRDLDNHLPEGLPQ